MVTLASVLSKSRKRLFSLFDLMMMDIVRISVFFWGHACAYFENMTEICRRCISKCCTDFTDRKKTVAQQFFGIFYTYTVAIFQWSCSRYLFKNVCKMIFAHTTQICIVFQFKIAATISVHMLYRTCNAVPLLVMQIVDLRCLTLYKRKQM